MTLSISIHLIIQPFEVAWIKWWKLQPYILVGIDSVSLFDMIEDPLWNWHRYTIWSICDEMLFMNSTVVEIYSSVLHVLWILSEVHEWCLDMSLPTTLTRKKIKMQLNIWYSYQSMRNGVGTHMSVDCLVKAHGSVPEGRAWSTCVSSVARLSKLKTTYRTNIFGRRAQQVGSSAIGSPFSKSNKLKNLSTQVFVFCRTSEHACVLYACSH